MKKIAIAIGLRPEIYEMFKEHKNPSVEVINLADIEKSELKELAVQLNSLSERENRVMQHLSTLDDPEKIQECFIPSPKHSSKGHQRPYRFHK